MLPSAIQLVAAAPAAGARPASAGAAPADAGASFAEALGLAIEPAAGSPGEVAAPTTASTMALAPAALRGDAARKAAPPGGVSGRAGRDAAIAVIAANDARAEGRGDAEAAAFAEASVDGGDGAAVATDPREPTSPAGPVPWPQPLPWPPLQRAADGHAAVPLGTATADAAETSTDTGGGSDTSAADAVPAPAAADPAAAAPAAVQAVAPGVQPAPMPAAARGADRAAVLRAVDRNAGAEREVSERERPRAADVASAGRNDERDVAVVRTPYAHAAFAVRPEAQAHESPAAPRRSTDPPALAGSEPRSEPPVAPAAATAAAPVAATPTLPQATPATAPMAAAASPEAAAAEVRIAVPVTAPEFMPRFAGELTLLARDGVHEARVHVHPAEMGPIAVQITLDGAQAQVHLVAENAQTRSLLEQSMPTLASALRESGLTLTGGGVFEQPRQPREQADAAPGPAAAAPRPAADDEAAASPIAGAPRVWRRQGVVDAYA